MSEGLVILRSCSQSQLVSDQLFVVVSFCFSGFVLGVWFLLTLCVTVAWPVFVP